MNNNSEQIGRYLQNEMNAEEKAAFEKQLTNDKDLQQELFIQKQIVKAVKTAGLKNTFRKNYSQKIDQSTTDPIRNWGNYSCCCCFCFLCNKNK
jgi:hypothetical protein